MKRKLLATLLTAIMSVSVFSADIPVLSAAFTVTAQAAAALSKPVASLKSGNYVASGAKSVKLTCSTKNAVIYYSVNGAAYKKYTSAIKITKNTTLKVFSKLNNKKSAVVTYTYKLLPKITTSVKSGEYDSAQIVKLTTKLKNVKLYYTLDGSKPTKKSTLYTSAGIKITDSCKLRVLAVKSGWSGRYYSFDYTISSDISILDDLSQKYYYNAITDKQKKIYKALYNGISARKLSIDLTNLHIDQGEFDYVWWLFAYENPQLYWVDTNDGYYYTYNDNGDICEVTPTYYLTNDAEIKKLGNKIDAVTQPIIEGALSQPDDYSTVLYLHDALCDLAEYNATDKFEQYSIVGAFIEKEIQCEGYAKAFMYLCQSVGIPAVQITGTSSGVDHAWNRIQLDGEWYLFDVTWDDTEGCYDYFGLTDAQMEALDHTTGTWFPLKGAEADSTDYYYYLREGITVHSTASSAYNALLKEAVSNYKKGNNTAVVYCEASVMNTLKNLVDASIVADLTNSGIDWDYCNFTWCTNKFILEIF